LSCDVSVPIKINKVKWCNEEYLEIFDQDTNQLVGRIKEKEIFGSSNSQNRVDISFSNSDFKGYCDYCFDGVKNYDETEIDCGGKSCPVCLEEFVYFDWVYWAILGSWVFFVLLFFIAIKKEISNRIILGYPDASFQEKIKNLFGMNVPNEERERILEERIRRWFTRGVKDF